jgi:two-component system response regulator PilR (NtrC family)
VSPERLLVVDDERGVREVLSVLFERAGYAVRTSPSGEQALLAYAEWAPDVVLTDLTMPGMSGLELLRQLKAAAANEGRDVPVIILTAHGSTGSAVEAMKEGAFDYVAKPFNNDELRLLVRRALNMRALEADNTRMRAELASRYQFGQFVGASPRMLEVYALVKRVMATRINVLVCGESGTGKELLARALHYGSDRSGGPFVALNCGAIPHELFESEIFGHVRGSFTGAVRDKVGHMEAADRGTLFLDEVGELPLAAQVKVLRAIQERTVTRVGGTGETAVDVRIVAATNRDLVAEVKAGRFREDLYYRLNVVQVDMPPLRERAADVAALAQHFVEKFASEYGKAVWGVTPEASRLLRAYRYPGNVRELQNIVERAVVLEAGSLLSAGSLPERVRGELGDAPGEQLEELDFPAGGIDLDARLGAMERRYLERALVASGGNRTQAARILGITFRSLRYRLLKFGMSEDEGDPG